MTALEPYRTPARNVEIVRVEECTSCMINNRKREERALWWKDKGKSYTTSMAMILPGFGMSAVAMSLSKSGWTGCPAFFCVLGFVIAAIVKTGNLLTD